MVVVVGPAVIVDLDGTVWDSRPWYAELVSATRRRYDPDRPIATVLREVRLTGAHFAQKCADSGGPPLYADIVASLESLHGCGVLVGAATNLPGWICMPMLAATGLDELLEGTVCYGDTVRHKPRPDPLLEACRRIGATVATSWYIGDDPKDARAALAADMSFGWASWGYTADQPAGTTKVLARPDEIASLFGDS